MDTALHSNHISGKGRLAIPFTAGEWAKGRDTVQIAITEYKGKPLLDLRCWYEAPDGLLKPSPKGLTLQLDALPKLTQAVQAAMAFASVNGLLANGGGE